MSDKPHLGGSYPIDPNTYMVDVFGYLLVRHEIKSVLDIGCGYGATMKWFSENGLCRVVGIEGWEDAIAGSEVRDRIIKHDFTDGICPVSEEFDLAWSAEFLEHVDSRYIHNYMRSFQCCRMAVITHAEPGQPGHHHVNCQSDDYWIDVFSRHGFRHNHDETSLLRRTDRWHAGWGRRTLMVFNRI